MTSPAELARRLTLVCVVALTPLACEQLVEQQDIRLLRRLPHDTAAYTQGLLFHEGFLYESTGRYGSSQLRKVALETGAVVQSVDLSDELFGEGLALVDSFLVQLTWKEGVALVYDLASLTVQREHAFTGEGWGLCYDSERLVMSDGTATLQMRDPTTFEVTGTLEVTSNGIPLSGLNELECVGGDVFANVYMTDRIVRIDGESGRVLSEIDGTRLTMATPRPRDPGAVLNGIAFDPAGGRFWVTGKLWPEVLEIELVP